MSSIALPSRTVCRVRGIQVHGDTPRALPGQRVALNLVGDGVAALDRGEMLGVAGRFGQTMRFMMTLAYLGREGAKPRVLESGARVHVMAGTAEVVGRIMFMEGEAPMAVGETRNVQVRLEKLAAATCRGSCRGAVLFARDAYWRRARAAFSLPPLSRACRQGSVRCYAALEAGDIEGAVDAWLALQALPVAAADVTAALDLVAGEAEAALRGLVAQGAACALAGSGGSLYADVFRARRRDGCTGDDPVSHACGVSQGDGLYARRRCPCCVACR